MADLSLSVAFNAQDLQNAINSVVNRQYSIRGINVSSIQQPLGKISASASEFEKSMAAANARVLAFGASASSILVVTRSLDFLTSSTINVERQMSEINSILNLSSKGLGKFSSEIFNAANSVSVGFSDASKAALEFARQGLGVEETLKRTKDSLVLAKIAGMDFADSATAITAAINSFNNELITSTDLVDRLTNADANFAVSAGDLAEAIKRVGSSASDANVTLNETIALVTSAQQTTARGGAVIGNSFKTIFTRLGRGSVLADLEKFGVATSDASGNALPLVQVLKNLASTYDSLSSKQQNFVAELVGGVYQINILKATLGDVAKEGGVFESVMRTVENSAGSADSRISKLSETISSKLVVNMNNAMRLASSMGNKTIGPIFKGVLDQSASGLESVAELIDGEGIGSKIANGMLGALKGILQGPGAALFGFIAAKLAGNFGSFIGDSASSFLGLNSAAKQQAEIQAQILNYLQSNPAILQNIYNGSMTVAQGHMVVLGHIRQQNALLDYQRDIASQIASIKPPAPSRSSGAPAGTTPAAGFIPNFNSQMAGQMMENAGAREHGYTAGRAYKTTVHDGNGNAIPTFVNSREKVENFTTYEGRKATMVTPPNGFGKGTMRAAGGFVPNFGTVYRGVNPKHGDTDRGRMSKGIINKLIGAIGPNYTDNEDIAKVFGSQVLSKKVNDKKLLRLGSYDEVAQLFALNQHLMTPGLAGRIKNSTGEEQQAAIEQAGGELRAILKKRKFSGIKSPLHPADAKYLSEEKGLGPGNLIIPLAGGFVPNFGPKPRVGSEGEERELGRGSGRRAFLRYDDQGTATPANPYVVKTPHRTGERRPEAVADAIGQQKQSEDFAAGLEKFPWFEAVPQKHVGGGVLKQPLAKGDTLGQVLREAYPNYGTNAISGVLGSFDQFFQKIGLYFDKRGMPGNIIIPDERKQQLMQILKGPVGTMYARMFGHKGGFPMDANPDAKPGDKPEPWFKLIDYSKGFIPNFGKKRLINQEGGASDAQRERLTEMFASVTREEPIGASALAFEMLEGNRGTPWVDQALADFETFKNHYTNDYTNNAVTTEGMDLNDPENVAFLRGQWGSRYFKKKIGKKGIFDRNHLLNPGTRPTAAGGFVPNFRQNDNSRQIMRDFLEIQHSNLRIADKRTADEAAVRAAAGLTPKNEFIEDSNEGEGSKTLHRGIRTKGQHSELYDLPTQQEREKAISDLVFASRKIPKGSRLNPEKAFTQSSFKEMALSHRIYPLSSRDMSSKTKRSDDELESAFPIVSTSKKSEVPRRFANPFNEEDFLSKKEFKNSRILMEEGRYAKLYKKYGKERVKQVLFRATRTGGGRGLGLDFNSVIGESKPLTQEQVDYVMSSGAPTGTGFLGNFDDEDEVGLLSGGFVPNFNLTEREASLQKDEKAGLLPHPGYKPDMGNDIPYYKRGGPSRMDVANMPYYEREAHLKRGRSRGGFSYSGGFVPNFNLTEREASLQKDEKAGLLPHPGYKPDMGNDIPYYKRGGPSRMDVANMPYYEREAHLKRGRSRGGFSYSGGFVPNFARVLDFDGTLGTAPEGITHKDTYHGWSASKMIPTPLVDTVRKEQEASRKAGKPIEDIIVTARGRESIPYINEWLKNQGLSVADIRATGDKERYPEGMTTPNKKVLEIKDTGMLKPGTIFSDDDKKNLTAAKRAAKEAGVKGFKTNLVNYGNKGIGQMAGGLIPNINMVSAQVSALNKRDARKMSKAISGENADPNRQKQQEEAFKFEELSALAVGNKMMSDYPVTSLTSIPTKGLKGAAGFGGGKNFPGYDSIYKLLTSNEDLARILGVQINQPSYVPLSAKGGSNIKIAEIKRQMEKGGQVISALIKNGGLEDLDVGNSILAQASSPAKGIPELFSDKGSFGEDGYVSRIARASGGFVPNFYNPEEREKKLEERARLIDPKSPEGKAAAKAFENFRARQAVSEGLNDADQKFITDNEKGILRAYRIGALEYGSDFMNTEAGEPNSTYASRGGLPGGIADKLREIVGKKGGRTAVSDLARNRGVTALAGGFVPNFKRESMLGMMDPWYSTATPKGRKRNGVQPMVHELHVDPARGLYNPTTKKVLVSDSKSRFNETLAHEEFGHKMFGTLMKTKGFSERAKGPLQAIKGDSSYGAALSKMSPEYEQHRNGPAGLVLEEAFAQSIGSRFDKNYAPGKDKQMDVLRGLTSSLITPRMEKQIRKYLEKNGGRLYDSLSKTKLPANKAKVKFSEMAAGFVPNFLDVSLLKPYREYLKKLKEGQYEVKDLNPKDRSAEEFQSQRGIEQGYELRGQYSHKTGIMSMDKNFMKVGAMEEKSKTVAHEGIHGIIAEMRKNQIAKREKALAEKTKVLHSPWSLLEEKDAATKKFEEMKSQPLIHDQLYSLSKNFSNFPESEKNKLSTVRRMSGNYDQRMTMEEALADGTADMPGERDVLGKALGLSDKKIGTIGKMSRSLKEAAAEGIKRKESSGGLMARLKSLMGGASRGFVPNFGVAKLPNIGENQNVEISQSKVQELIKKINAGKAPLSNLESYIYSSLTNKLGSQNESKAGAAMAMHKSISKETRAAYEASTKSATKGIGEPWAQWDVRKTGKKPEDQKVSNYKSYFSTDAESLQKINENAPKLQASLRPIADKYDSDLSFKTPGSATSAVAHNDSLVAHYTNANASGEVESTIRSFIASQKAKLGTRAYDRGYDVNNKEVGYPEERNQEGGLKKVSSYGEVLAKRAARELMAGKTMQEVSPIFKSGFAGGFVPNFAYPTEDEKGILNFTNFKLPDNETLRALDNSGIIDAYVDKDGKPNKIADSVSGTIEIERFMGREEVDRQAKAAYKKALEKGAGNKLNKTEKYAKKIAAEKAGGGVEGMQDRFEKAGEDLNQKTTKTGKLTAAAKSTRGDFNNFKGAFYEHLVSKEQEEKGYELSGGNQTAADLIPSKRNTNPAFTGIEAKAGGFSKAEILSKAIRQGGITGKNDDEIQTNLTFKPFKVVSTNAAGGFIPNFNALKDSVGREMAAGYSASQIRIGSSKSLVTSSNPGGMGVYNSTERNLAHGISLATGAGIEPKTKGASKGFIPNFAVDNDSTGLAVMGSVLIGVIAAIKQHTDAVKADTEAVEDKKAKRAERKKTEAEDEKISKVEKNRTDKRVKEDDTTSKTRGAEDEKRRAAREEVMKKRANFDSNKEKGLATQDLKAPKRRVVDEKTGRRETEAAALAARQKEREDEKTEREKERAKEDKAYLGEGKQLANKREQQDSRRNTQREGEDTGLARGKSNLENRRKAEADAKEQADIDKEDAKNKKAQQHSKFTKIAVGASAAAGALPAMMDEGPAKAGMQAFSSSLSLASSAVAAIPGPVGLAIGGVIAIAGAAVGVAKFFSTSESLRAKAELMKKDLEEFSAASKSVVSAYENYNNALYDVTVSSEKVAQLNNEIAISMAKLPDAYRADFQAKMASAGSQGERASIQADMQAKMSKDVAVTDRLAVSSGKTDIDFTKSFAADLIGQFGGNGSNRYTNTTILPPNAKDKAKQKQELNKDVFAITESATSTKEGTEKFRELTSDKSKSNDDFKNDLANLVPEEAREGIQNMKQGEIELLRARMRQVETARQVSEMMGNVMKPFVEAERDAKRAAQEHVNTLRQTGAALRTLAAEFSTLGIAMASSSQNSKLKGETKIFSARSEYARGATGEQTGAAIEAQVEYVQTVSAARQTQRTESAKAIQDSLQKGTTSKEGQEGVQLTDKDRKANAAISAAMQNVDLTQGSPEEVIKNILANVKPEEQDAAKARLESDASLPALLTRIQANTQQTYKEAEEMKNQQTEANKLLAIQKQDDKKFGGIENFLDKGKRREDTKEFNKGLRMSGSSNAERRGEGAMRVILQAQKDLGGSLTTEKAGPLKDMAIQGRAKQIERTADQRIKAIQQDKSMSPQQKKSLIAAYQESKGRSKEIAKEQVERAAKLENAPIDAVKGLSAIEDLLKGTLKVNLTNPEAMTAAGEKAAKDAKTKEDEGKEVARKEKVRQEAASKAGTMGQNILEDKDFATDAEGKDTAGRKALLEQRFNEKAGKTNQVMAEKIKIAETEAAADPENKSKQEKVKNLKEQDEQNREEQPKALEKIKEGMEEYDPKKVLAKDEANKGMVEAIKKNTTALEDHLQGMLVLGGILTLAGVGIALGAKAAAAAAAGGGGGILASIAAGGSAIVTSITAAGASAGAALLAPASLALAPALTAAAVAFGGFKFGGYLSETLEMSGSKADLAKEAAVNDAQGAQNAEKNVAAQGNPDAYRANQKENLQKDQSALGDKLRDVEKRELEHRKKIDSKGKGASISFDDRMKTENLSRERGRIENSIFINKEKVESIDKKEGRYSDESIQKLSPAAMAAEKQKTDQAKKKEDLQKEFANIKPLAGETQETAQREFEKEKQKEIKDAGLVLNKGALVESNRQVDKEALKEKEKYDSGEKTQLNVDKERAKSVSEMRVKHGYSQEQAEGMYDRQQSVDRSNLEGQMKRKEAGGGWLARAVKQNEDRNDANQKVKNLEKAGFGKEGATDEQKKELAEAKKKQSYINSGGQLDAEGNMPGQAAKPGAKGPDGKPIEDKKPTTIAEYISQNTQALIALTQVLKGEGDGTNSGVGVSVGSSVNQVQEKLKEDSVNSGSTLSPTVAESGKVISAEDAEAARRQASQSDNRQKFAETNPGEPYVVPVEEQDTREVDEFGMLKAEGKLEIPTGDPQAMADKKMRDSDKRRSAEQISGNTTQALTAELKGENSRLPDVGVSVTPKNPSTNAGEGGKDGGLAESLSDLKTQIEALSEALSQAQGAGGKLEIVLSGGDKGDQTINVNDGDISEIIEGLEGRLAMLEENQGLEV